MTRTRLRLIKVAVQPVFVLDDGETITEMDHPVAEIPAAEWPTYSSERFPRELAEWQAKLDAEDDEPPKSANAETKRKATTQRRRQRK